MEKLEKIKELAEAIYKYGYDEDPARSNANEIINLMVNLK